MDKAYGQLSSLSNYSFKKVANILSLGIQAIPPSIVPANVCTEAYYTRKKRQTIRQ